MQKDLSLHNAKFHITVLLLFIWCFGTVLCTSDAMAALPAAYYKQQAMRFYWGSGVKKDLAHALSLYMQAASMGDPEAQYIAGAMYFTGQGTDRNMQMGFKLLHTAARNGKSTPDSQKIIAQSFLLGTVAPKNIPEAVKWYSQAADEGDRDAQNELGFMYFVGKGVEQDFQKAFTLFLKAAERGLSVAQYNIGIMYFTGNGVEQTDLVQAYVWLNLAAAAGHQESAAARQYLESLLTSSQLEDAQKQSQKKFEQISEYSQSANIR